MAGKKGRELSITGIVVPEDWDEHDNVIRVGVKTSEYEEYVVEHNKPGKELLALIDREVCVKGRARERLDGELIITVNSFEVIGKEREGQHAA